MIVGLTGYAGAGKDTAALGLIDRGWARVAFADPLKEIARAIGWNGVKDYAGRDLLQKLGQAVRAHLGADVWVDAARQRVSFCESGLAASDIVITDVRYRNEIDMIHDVGGIVIVVSRPGVQPANDHISEHDWTKGRHDGVIVNDCDRGTLQRRLVNYVGFAEAARS